MALPILTNDKPMYDVVVPSLQQSYKFRPFLVVLEYSDFARF